MLNMTMKKMKYVSNMFIWCDRKNKKFNVVVKLSI